MLRATTLAAFLLLGVTPQRPVRSLLAARTGVVQLPSGVIQIDSEIALPEGAHDLVVAGNSTTLRASDSFHGRAILSCRRCRHITVRNLSIDGNRAHLEKPQAIPPTGETFAKSFANNGLLIEESDGVTVENVTLRNIAAFAVLASQVHRISIRHVDVSDSGEHNPKGRNNTTGGILVEEASTDFEIADCTLRSIRGNGIWTHSRYVRNSNGIIARNTITEIGRDAIQVGHSVNVQVRNNHGMRIGFPDSEIDVEVLATPVGVDTAGNVDHSVYENNRFEEINGKCFDLDGFHDGVVRGNTCISRGRPEDYSCGNFGIVINNAHPDMESRNIVIENNLLSGMKFGGIFVVGTGHIIRNNRIERVNMAHCPENSAHFPCVGAQQPGVLESGIYLSAKGERPVPVRGNTIEHNVIRGWRMKSRCIGLGTGVRASDNIIRANECIDE